MKNIAKKKLTLSTETIMTLVRPLHEDDLRNVVGGTGGSCPQTINHNLCLSKSCPKTN